jgi:protoporphyrinogen oxidase
MRQPTIILGAGPAGLAAAFVLGKHKRRFILVEKNDAVGGLARTLTFDSFRTDIGPHRFFSQNPRLYDFAARLLGKQWISVQRLTRFYLAGRFLRYPVELGDALRNVGFARGCRIVADYLFERGRRMFSSPEPKNFAEQVIADFGYTLAKMNMLNYTEKIWGIPCDQISPDWAKQRIKGLSLREVFLKAFVRREKNARSLVDHFYYPETGAGLLYEKMKEVIAREEGKLLLSSKPVAIEHARGKIRRIVLDTPQGRVALIPGDVISTIPLTNFLFLLRPEAPRAVTKAAAQLRFRAHVSLLIALRKSSVFPDQWIYFPDREIPFGRVTEPRNFSGKMSPQGKTSLLLEFFCWRGSREWQASAESLLKLSLPWLKKLGFVHEREIMALYRHAEAYAYPVYDLHYQQNLSLIKEYLAQFANLQLVGRGGRFRYNNQDHALEMGFLAARGIVEGRYYDLEQIGAEQEYLERGLVPVPASAQRGTNAERAVA